METKYFIAKTNDIVKLLMRAAGNENYVAAARITTAQAEMNCDLLIDECNELIRELKKGKVELMGLRLTLNGNDYYNEDTNTEG